MRSAVPNLRRGLASGIVDKLAIEKEKSLLEMSQAEFLKEVTVPEKMLNEYKQLAM